MSRLDAKPQIGKLASDLGLKQSGKPVAQILQFVRRKIQSTIKKYNCQSLQSLLRAAACEAGTIFREIHSDEDLANLVAGYVAKGEAIFANLHNELGQNDCGITIKRRYAANWEPPFVSIIDCRGEKVYRAYFTKWHELAHLLTLTPQMRLVFRRTHGAALQDPEEALMDIIAGEVGFFSDLLSIEGTAAVSFENIERIRAEFCPEASYQSSLIGIVKALPQPCILVEAAQRFKRGEESAGNAASPLRVIHVTVNQAARDAGVIMHPNWRVPRRSAIYSAFEQGASFEAMENLDWWTTSDGSRLVSCDVLVKAKYSPCSVTALVVPQR